MLKERPWIDRLGGKWTHRSRMSTKMWRKGNPSSLLEQMWMRGASVENSMEMPPETQNRTTRWSSNSTLGHISRQEYSSKRYMHHYIQSSTIYNSQDMEETWISTKRVMDEEGVLWWRRYTRTYVYNGTSLSLKKEWNNAFSATQMDLCWSYMRSLY